MISRPRPPARTRAACRVPGCKAGTRGRDAGDARAVGRTTGGSTTRQPDDQIPSACTRAVAADGSADDKADRIGRSSPPIPVSYSSQIRIPRPAPVVAEDGSTG